MPMLVYGHSISTRRRPFRGNTSTVDHIIDKDRYDQRGAPGIFQNTTMTMIKSVYMPIQKER